MNGAFVSTAETRIYTTYRKKSSVRISSHRQYLSGYTFQMQFEHLEQRIVSEKGAHIYQSIHSTGLLVMLESWAFLTRNVNKTWEFISFCVVAPAVPQKHLDHAGMVTGVVTGPWRAILHDPSLRRRLHGFGNKRIDPHLEFFIFSLITYRKLLQY